MASAIIVRLGFHLWSAKWIDLPDVGRVFLNNTSDVTYQKGDFVLLRPEGDFGFSVTPCASVASGFKQAATMERLGELVLEAQLCQAFKPRNFHAKVAEGITEEMKKFSGCNFGTIVKLEDGSSVILVSAAPIPADSLVEAVQAQKSFLVVRVADFVSDEPFKYESFASFVADLLNEAHPKLKGRLVPKPPKPSLTGIWLGERLDFINRRCQASWRVLIDGSQEGTFCEVFFTRGDATPEVPIDTGAAVVVRHDFGANFKLIPYEGRLEVATLIEPEKVPELLGVKLKQQEYRPESGSNIRVVKRAVPA